MQALQQEVAKLRDKLADKVRAGVLEGGRGGGAMDSATSVLQVSLLLWAPAAMKWGSTQTAGLGRLTWCCSSPHTHTLESVPALVAAAAACGIVAVHVVTLCM